MNELYAVLRVLIAARDFERAAEQYLTETEYELDFELGENAAEIFVNVEDAIACVRNLIDKEKKSESSN